ncbi:phosphotransferase [Saccharothrix sp. BKS2]|uniref:phosphotransferase family protein n=1 Tax=Saccharothrix sp. BKS2 TaxID=3064400 RepID=UPI0039EB1520
MNSDLVAGMAALVGPAAEPEVLAVRGDVVVVRVGDVVLKAHEAGTDPVELAGRLRLAADPRLAGLLLPPLLGPEVVAGRVVSGWPRGTPVPQSEPEDLPMEAAGRMLAELHRFAAADFAPPVPAAGAWPRMRRAVRELTLDTPAADLVRRAFATLPGTHSPGTHSPGTHSPGTHSPGTHSPGTRAAGTGAAGGRAAGTATAGDWTADHPAAADPITDHPTTGDPLPGTTLIHGDWHLGQLVRRDGGYRLIDVDDLGVGDPAWDLARPAALHLVGVLDEVAWGRLLGAYLGAGGTGVPRDDPWSALEVPARALVVQMAARALTAAERDGTELNDAQDALLAACARIVSTHEPMRRG